MASLYLGGAFISIFDSQTIEYFQEGVIDDSYFLFPSNSIFWFL
ncbi:hypothetical protein SBF1_3350012 [Candidatus Desulfosporosinus infrequens]|uniref:Uncharacterized protein n=1 Tax=Candidatus Desulfosporosinus infrequens TaxID=2043169 RepID=A0A2U3L177_9FIRM|nr:hypothetical protein SBF1_3350012 [Candidatus Desulfosporosinus infrequens]